MSAFLTNDVAAERGSFSEQSQQGYEEQGESTPAPHAGIRFLRRLLRDPMLQFIVAGAFIFGATQLIAAYRDNSARTIVVDDALRSRLGKLYALQLGAAPTDAQLAGLIDTYVHDEILYREALALGLDAGDEIIRRRLVQKMGFLQSDLIIATDPDEKTLRDFYQSHPAQFAEPARVSFQQYFFAADSDVADPRRAERTRAQLNATTTVPRADTAGPLAVEYRQLDRTGLTQLFGTTPIVDALLQVPVGQWQGPFRSGYGWHLVRIEQREEPAVPPFESVRDTVAETVRAQQKEENNRRSFEQLRARYDVQIAAPQAASTQVAP